MSNEILRPVVVLIAWSIIMWGWMIAARLPALKAAGIDLSRARGGRPGQLDGMVPDKAQWPAHNYNHLMEQPTIFYAVALLLAVAGAGGGLNATLAWIYVGLRIVHSLIQATFNKIGVRFLVFVASTLVLAALTLHAALTVF